jgi:hypothetical protein
VLRFALYNKSHPVFFSQLFICMEGIVLFPPKLHKLTLGAPSRMRDNLHSYLLPLLLQLFQILNICLNTFFLKNSSFSFLVNSSNPYRVSDTLYRAARPQTLNNLVFTFVSKGTPSSLTRPTFITSIKHFVCNLGFH